MKDKKVEQGFQRRKKATFVICFENFQTCSCASFGEKDTEQRICFPKLKD